MSVASGLGAKQASIGVGKGVSVDVEAHGGWAEEAEPARFTGRVGLAKAVE